MYRAQFSDIDCINDSDVAMYTQQSSAIRILVLFLMSDPERRLPVELERMVFELAAHARTKSIPTLLLVARRVKIWLEPILYSVVVFSDPIDGHVCLKPVQFSSIIQSQEISQHVRHLFASYELGPHLDLILASCSAVKNLALVPGRWPDLLPFLSTMPLQRLSTAITNVFPAIGVDFAHPLFSNLTHLELMDHLNDAPWEEWKGLALIPNLTHLAFLFQKSLAIFQGALDACPALQVLVYLYFKGVVYEEIHLQPLAQDTRFVCMPAPPFASDWQIGARDGDDFGCAQKDSSLSGSLGRLIPFETLVILSITVGITLAAGITPAREAFVFEARSIFVWARTAHGEVDIHLPLLDGNRIEPCSVEIDNSWIPRFLPNTGFVDALHNGNKSIAGTATLRRSQKRFGAKIVGFQPSDSAAAVTHEERSGVVVGHQTLLWIHDRKLKAEGFGIMILSCATRPASS
ncbi:hypothetical protein B0H14DRAFT_3642669 [Mycena olivaceomarginata]|nr:hypothetical protein B0H14DRAFT_3642669 [Mycena olivaceomarginata]